MSDTILVVEDDETLADNLRAYLQRNQWEAVACGSAEEALELVASLQPGIVLTDHNLPAMTGIAMVSKVHAIDPDIKVIVMTGDESVQTAVDAMKAGACDYVNKPVALAEVKLLIERALGERRMQAALAFHRAQQARGAGVDAMIGTSPAILELKSTIGRILEAERRMTDSDLPAILIHGETGTGKELVARALHFDGQRHEGPFVEVNCASIPTHLLESELFGYEKGAFTDARERKLGLVEAADGGTLFLDEIGEIDPAMQAKLLKLIEEKKVRRVGAIKEQRVDIRVLSATNRNLDQMVREGKFRSDLYFRLRILSLTTPPLRARADDILLLARHFLALHSRRYGKAGMYFHPDAEQVLKRYGWPGNVRELRNTIEQTVLLAGGLEVIPKDLPICPGMVPASGCDRSFRDTESYCMSFPPKGVRLSEVERDLVVKALEKTDWNVTKSAKLLGLSRDMLRYRIEKLELERPQN